MTELLRFGVSLPEKLLKEFDLYISQRKYSNRSEAIRDLIRDILVKREWFENEKEVIGAIIIVYDHHKRELVNKLISIQHDFGDLILSSQHIHINHNNCLEIIAVKGLSEKVRTLADSLKAIKGVKHATLSMSTTGMDLV